MPTLTIRRSAFTSGMALIIYVALVRVVLYVIAAPQLWIFPR